ncbi:MAG: DNA repair protein RadA [Candidatus Dependentiae bacterium]|nr:DNA repair protein RadA [Candidatus Dependentiae bacterium]
MKTKILFSCTACGYETSKWLGCCPQCGTWNTIEELPKSFSRTAPSGRGASRSGTGSAGGRAAGCALALQPLSQISTTPVKRLVAGIGEWDRVLGGGMVPGSFLILTGDPGIGKSTLLLHVAHALAMAHKVFYISSEESLDQVKLRAERIGCRDERLLFSDRAHLDDIIATAEEHRPDLLIIDSIQNCYSDDLNSQPGSIGQLREAAFRLMRLAKEQTIAILLSGHITKEGTIAGPRMLEHMVDGVFYLQGEDRWQTRILRGVKNRFGTINELGFFEMGEGGMAECPQLSQLFLDELSQSPGSALVSYLEGSRPILLELQALTIASQYGMPQRVVSGIDPKQVVLIAAILEKYLHVKLSASDIFFKISGGLKIRGNTTDLGIALALLSSFFQQPLPAKSLAIGELSLTGQVKPVNLINLHIGEAEKFGIKMLFIAQNQRIEKTSGQIRRFKTVGELLSLFE